MKASKNILAIVALMAAGVAGAAAPTANPNGYTIAGQPITNTATASYTDPNTKLPAPEVTSNMVTTTVLPLPGFDIVYDSNGPDGSGDSANKANSVSTTTPGIASIAPNTTKDMVYDLVNNGNTPLTVHIVPTLSDNLPAANVTYSGLGTANGDGSYDVVLPAADSTKGTTGIIQFTQTIKLPSDAVPGSVYGATPVGTVLGKGVAVNGIIDGKTLNENQAVSNGTNTPSSVYGINNSDPVGTPETGTNSFAANDLQYQAVQPTNAVLTNTPDTTPGTSTVTPPSGTTPPGTPTYDGGKPPTTGTGTPPDNGTTPGTTPIVISGDQQVAYPPADSNTTDPNKYPDVVDFTNTVTNGSATQDIVTLSPGPLPKDKNGNTVTPTNGTKVTDSLGKEWTYTGTGSWTNTDGVKVQFLNGSNVTDTVTVPANGKADYITQVTYPDSNPNAGTTTLDNPKPATVIVTTTSGNNPNVSDMSVDTVYPAAATFGDTSQQGGVASTSDTKNITTPVNQTSPVTTVTGGFIEDPSKAIGPNDSGTLTIPTITATTPGSTATFNMTVSNTGQYPDKYTLAGGVAIPTGTSGGYTVVPVNYAGASATLASGASATAALNPVTNPSNPVPTGYQVVSVKLPDGSNKDYYAPVYTTTDPVLAGGITSSLTANVTVPSNAQANTTFTPVLSQYATGLNSKIVMQDMNDPLPIKAKGSVVIGKFTQSKDASTPVAGTQYASGDPAQVSTSAPTDSTVPYVTNPLGYDGLKAADQSATQKANTSYLPGVNYNYQIIAKNGYNAPISNFTLKDPLANTSLLFQAVTCTVYKADGTTVDTAVTGVGPATTNPAAGTNGPVACAAINLPAGDIEVMQLTVSIK